MDNFDCEFFYSWAKNLALYREEDGTPTAGIRIDLAPFLMNTVKLLSDHGFDIRRSHGKETRRYIKIDEENMSLLLEVKISGQQKWIKIWPDQGRAFSEEKDKMEYQSIKRGLLRGQSDTSTPNLVPLGLRVSSISVGDPAPGPSNALPSYCRCQSKASGSPTTGRIVGGTMKRESWRITASALHKTE